MSKSNSEALTMEQRRRLAAQVKQVRRHLKMTQQELADASGVARQTVSNLERGTVPQTENLIRILDTLGIDTTGSDYSEDTDMWLGILGGMLESLPPTRRGVAGQSAVNAVAAELASNSNVVSLDAHRVRGTEDNDLLRVAFDDDGDDGEDDTHI